MSVLMSLILVPKFRRDVPHEFLPLQPLTIEFCMLCRLQMLHFILKVSNVCIRHAMTKFPVKVLVSPVHACVHCIDIATTCNNQKTPAKDASPTIYVFSTPLGCWIYLGQGRSKFANSRNAFFCEGVTVHDD